MLIGTPIDQDRPANAPVWEQYATDERGRRRFHGAFTGGFSAGYFNTVGSKEGFEPKSFKSSREERGKFEQRPEDFMDEEDYNQSVAGGSILSTKDAFTESKEPSNSKLFVPDDVLAPRKESIGVKLLRIMGWSPGESITARVLPQKRPREEASTPAEAPPKRRVMGPVLADLISPAEPAKEEDNSAAYLSVIRKAEDVRGLGYQNEDPQFNSYRQIRERQADSSSVKMAMNSFSTATQVSKKFGQGVFEDTDDIDVYSNDDDMSNYDTTLGGAAAPTGRKSGNQAPPGYVKPSFRFTGRLVTEGKSYPPPKVPEDFVPMHQFDSTKQEAPSVGGKPMSATRRGEILGERQLPVHVPEGSESGAISAGARRNLPFAHDAAKQQRYVAFLQGNYASAAEDLHEFVQEDEKKEFARTRDKFKQIPDELAGRFTKATVTTAEMEEELVRKEKEEEERQKAMPLLPPVRDEEDWAPAPLLCKRFGERNPYATSRPKPRSIKESSVAKDISDMFALASGEQPTNASSPAVVSKPAEPSLEELQKEIPAKVGMEVFKAIFDSDSEDE